MNLRDTSGFVVIVKEMDVFSCDCGTSAGFRNESDLFVECSVGESGCIGGRCVCFGRTDPLVVPVMCILCDSVFCIMPCQGCTQLSAANL